MKTNIGCTNFTAIAINHNPDLVNIAQLRCKQWSCAYCAKKNARQWRAALIDAINKIGGNWSFWTITVPSWIRKLPDNKRYAASIKLIQKNWDKFMKRAKRKYGFKTYARIIEQHKDGTAHIHLLASCHIPDICTVQRKDKSSYGYTYWHEKALKDCKFGYIMDIRNLIDDGKSWHGGSVATYVTKYVTKDMATNDQTRKDLRVRKIQTSRDIKRVNVKSEDAWELKSGLYLEDFQETQKTFFDVTLKSQINIDMFRGGVVYPPIEHDGD